MGLGWLLIMIVFMGISPLYADFITKDEYAKMLYQNPRGIGCDKCHGLQGEGMTLSSYVNDKGEKVNITAPAINNISMKQFKDIFETKSKLMPVYFLTENEKAYLYYYLTKTNEKEREEDVD